MRSSKACAEYVFEFIAPIPMTTHKTYRMLAGCIAALLVSAAAHAADWSENYATAVAQAKKEHKLILLDFTGSDWCIWCKRTDAEVFDTKQFKDYADKKLVLVRLDFPKERPMPAEVKAQNAKLQEKFNIEGYPTLIVLNPDGKVVLTQSGYKPGGPEAFIASIPPLAN
jgi:thioredoxin-related protein